MSTATTATSVIHIVDTVDEQEVTACGLNFGPHLWANITDPICTECERVATED